MQFKDKSNPPANSDVVCVRYGLDANKKWLYRDSAYFENNVWKNANTDLPISKVLLVNFEWLDETKEGELTIDRFSEAAIKCFIGKWECWFMMEANGKELRAAFEKELYALFEKQGTTPAPEQKREGVASAEDVLFKHFKKWCEKTSHTKEIVTKDIMFQNHGIVEICLPSMKEYAAQFPARADVTEACIKTEIYKHLNSLPYEGGFPGGWQETLANHLYNWITGHTSNQTNPSK